MRLSNLLSKRIINIFDGEILGLVGDADLLIDPQTGDISAMIIPWRGGAAMAYADKRRLPADRHLLRIPWEKVCKVGSEVIVVDINPELQ